MTWPLTLYGQQAHGPTQTLSLSLMWRTAGWTQSMFYRSVEGRESHQRRGFMRFSPARLTAPSHGGRPLASKSSCNQRERERSHEREGGERGRDQMRGVRGIEREGDIRWGGGERKRLNEVDLTFFRWPSYPCNPVRTGGGGKLGWPRDPFCAATGWAHDPRTQTLHLRQNTSSSQQTKNLHLRQNSHHHPYSKPRTSICNKTHQPHSKPRTSTCNNSSSSSSSSAQQTQNLHLRWNSHHHELNQVVRSSNETNCGVRLYRILKVRVK